MDRRLPVLATAAPRTPRLPAIIPGPAPHPSRALSRHPLPLRDRLRDRVKAAPPTPRPPATIPAPVLHPSRALCRLPLPPRDKPRDQVKAAPPIHRQAVLPPARALLPRPCIRGCPWGKAAAGGHGPPLHLWRQGQRSCADKGVPKCKLGTREKSTVARRSPATSEGDRRFLRLRSGQAPTAATWVRPAGTPVGDPSQSPEDLAQLHLRHAV